MTQLHVRHQLRQSVALALKAAAIVASDSVMPHRRRPTTNTQLPALLVYTDDEASARETAEADRRIVDLVIRVRVKTVGDDVPQDELDAIALQVERTIFAAGTFGGLVKDLQLARSESAASANSDRQLGDIDLVFQVEIHTAANDPATPV